VAALQQRDHYIANVPGLERQPRVMRDEGAVGRQEDRKLAQKRQQRRAAEVVELCLRHRLLEGRDIESRQLLVGEAVVS